MDPLLLGSALLVGLLIGLTGVGGGSIMTPLLILLFGISPQTAVSSDLVASLVIKPFGAAFHATHQRVDRSLLLWMGLGSVPAAFSGALLLSLIPNEDRVNGIVRLLVGITLALTASTFLAQLLSKPRDEPADPDVRVQPAVVLALGALAGLLVGLTSIGSGSIIAAGLLLIYPRMPVARVIGTDVAHAIPMVGAAALGHLLFGHVQLPLAFTLMLGGIPGVLLGAMLVGKVPAAALRLVLGVLLISVSLTLLRAPTSLIFGVPAIAAVIAITTMGVKRVRRDRRKTFAHSGILLKTWTIGGEAK
jgi:uncharacterized membrane protein YfcA